MAATSKTVTSQRIRAGDAVLISGLFVNAYGAQKNTPMIRNGKIALIPEEPIPTRAFGAMEGYLIEARSIGGLSCSPVFVYPAGPGRVLTQPEQFSWLGLVHGHWDVPVPDTHEFAAIARINMGIAIVVPAVKVLEIIDQPRWRAARAAEIDRQRRGT